MLYSLFFERNGGITIHYAIILAGGIGQRVGAGIPKQFIPVLGKPIMIYTLETFQKCALIDEIILVCVQSHMEQAKAYCRQYGIDKITAFVEGGADFVHSCMNGMNYLKDKAPKGAIAIVSSADRPFMSEEELKDSIETCKKHGSGVAARPCSLCMFRVEKNQNHSAAYMRDELVQTATPWTFDYHRLQDALDRYEQGEFPGCEAYPIAIYAAAGNEIYFSKAKAKNIKITEKHDVALMEHMLLAEREAADHE